MKKLSAMLLVCLLAAVSTNAQRKSDREQTGLSGRIKSLLTGTIEFSLKDGKSVEGKRVPRHAIAFDEDGNKTEEIGYKDDGSILTRVVFDYGASGRITSYESNDSGCDKPYTGPSRRDVVLDSNGNEVEVTTYQADGSVADKFLYKYDSKGNKTEELYYSWNGTRMGKLVYTYDDKGNQLTHISYNSDDTLSFKIISAYDARGHQTEWVQYQGDTLRYKIFYKYDDKGRLAETETFEFNVVPGLRSSHSPVPGKVVYTYDDNKRTKEIATYNVDGSLKERVIQELDRQGNEIGVETFNADGSIKDSAIHWYDKNRWLRTLSGKALNSFEYDSQGNWTRKTFLIQSRETEEPEAYGAEYRVITYY